MFLIVSILKLYLTFNAVAYGSATCNDVIASLGGPRDELCVIFEEEHPIFKQCLRDLRDVVQLSDWYKYCNNTQLDFYKKDKNAFYKIIKSRSYSGPKNRGEFAISPSEWALYKKNPSIYANCVELKAQVDKDTYFSECDTQDLTAFANHHTTFELCLVAAKKSGRRISPKQEFDCANPSVISFFEKDVGVIDYCFDWMGSSYSLELNNCLQMDQSLVASYPHTYIHCLKEVSRGDTTRCSNEIQYTADIEKCFSIYRNVDSINKSFCASFKRSGPIASNNLRFVLDNEIKVRLCIDTITSIFPQDHRVGSICSNSDYIQTMVAHTQTIQACLKKSTSHYFVPDVCFSNSFIDAAESIAGAEENIFSCYKKYRVRSVEDQFKISSVCHSTFGLKCATDNPSFWKSFHSFYDNYINGMDHFHRLSISLDSEKKIGCPPVGLENNWFLCLDQYRLTEIERNDDPRGKKFLNAGAACSSCIEGVEELVSYDSSKYRSESGLMLCRKLATENSFPGLTKDQICFALANRYGFREKVSAAWMVAEQATDALFKLGSIFGGMQLLGPSCPQYIFPLPGDAEAVGEREEEVVSGSANEKTGLNRPETNPQ